jgi:plastocyanin
MSWGSRSRRRSTVGSAPPRLSLFAALTIVLVLAFGSVPMAVAQDATPITGECNAPDVPEGTPEPMDMASPEASPAGSPVAEEPTGEVVEDEAVAEEVTAGLTGVFACFNDGDYLSASALLTENYRLNQFGTANLYSVAALLEEFAAGGERIEVTAVYDVLDLGDGRYGVENDQVSGKQVTRYLSVLVEEDGFYKLDEEIEQTPTTDQNSVTISLQAATDESEYAYELLPAEVPQAPAMFIRFFNVGEMDHEAVIFKTPEDFDPATLLEAEDESDLPEGVEFVGAGYAPPGEEQTLLLLDLEVGTYTIYCFIPAPDGEPHAAKGMITQLTITEPVELDVPDITGGSPEATPDD